MEKHIIGKTGDIASVKRQFWHTNPAYFMQLPGLPTRRFRMWWRIGKWEEDGKFTPTG